MLSIFLVQSEIIVVGCVIVDYWENTGIYCLTIFFFLFFFNFIFYRLVGFKLWFHCRIAVDW